MNRVFLLLASCLLAACTGSESDVALDVVKAGNQQIPTDSAYVRYWNHALPCLGISTPYDRTLRFYEGTHLPASWRGEPGAFYAGYANALTHQILLSPSAVVRGDSLLIAHEEVHIATGSGKHPAPYFGEAMAAKCGVLPGHDP